ncbi:TIGR01777 family oxidoreductase [Paenibacillus eucommiae]|uniref:Uncharacterized protein (TIGR01777 family) n=1 Tax=Paenibacillus eucommiae TaxID=1355755 RepID=A0ABS4IP53_9BACL|nr:TIGR01777 family oxidoreductase [Paenibacillus eucommiae]MBP1989293.1 uncharacterized protein (TIGR01777 family) [Paenibacillus eucommiae]
MKIMITGGSGFVGGHLIPFLQSNGHHVILVSRSASTDSGLDVTKVTWNQLREESAALEGIDAIVNLAGESINQRWTPAAKKRILESRLQAAGQISDFINRLKVKPKVVVNASGMSIYGDSETEAFDERSPHRVVDFLSGIVEKWEQAADQIKGTRIVKIRIGVVLGNDGGAFPKMALPYKLGIGGRVGSGKQWISWVHIEDMVRLIAYCIEHETINGPVNATAPSPVTNDQFGRAIARSLRRPHWFPVPSFMMKLVFGELSTLLLDGQKVIPRALLEHGFTFKFPGVDQALQDLAANR